MRVLLTLLFALSLILAQTLAFAQDTFSIEQANRAFDNLSIKLSTQNLQAGAFADAIETLSTLRDQAEICQTEANKALSDTAAKLSALAPNTNGNRRVDAEYLLKKQETLVKRESECRLFVLQGAPRHHPSAWTRVPGPVGCSLV